MGLPRALLATALSALLYALAFPPAGVRGLAWVALVPLLLALRDASLARRIGLGVLWSFLAGWGVGTWMPRAVASYFDQPLAVGAALFLGVTATMAAPYYALFAVLYGPIARGRAAFVPLCAGAAWAGAELLRGRLLNGTPIYVGSSPWATFGASQFGVDLVVQVASLGGVYAVSAMLAAVNAALAEALARWRRDRAAIVAPLAAGAAVVAASLGFGAFALRGAAAPAASPTPIALVQGNLSAASRWEPGGAVRTLDAYLRLTQAALEHGRVQIVFWPEAALTSFLEREPFQLRAIGRIAAANDVELVLGAPHAEGDQGGPPYRNSVYRIEADGSLGARYDKQRLLPFMEYFPIGIDLLRRRFGRIRHFEAGATANLLETRAGAAGILVCNEALLPHLAGERMAAGAAYLVNPSNDSWVSDAGFAEQQFELAAFRAVEQRAYLVRASDSGPSAVIDPFGRVLARSRPGTRDVVHAAIAPETRASIYGRIGDLFGALCLAVAAFAALRGRRRARSR